ncbi:MAG: Malate-2H(+)/Na(+)-lactate antiporter [Chlamydiae bacterium]|nr:Malate-2H(+)/Na(+)-lactate antiporter [Chlamydiota bacterium]
MHTLLVLLPPIIVFILGAITHRVILSLFVGVITAALIATDGSCYEAFFLTSKHLWLNCETNKWISWDAFVSTNKLFVVGFIICSSIMFHLMQRSNGVNALVKLTSRRIKNARSAETTSLLLSHSLFIDGCLSSITVSSIIRPIADRFKIPRLKTALLADSMSGPLVVICPFSCFAALLIALLHNNGVESKITSGTLLHANPNTIYWLALPFSLYSLSIIATLWMIVRARISLGQMRIHEQHVIENHSEQTDEKHSGKIWNFFIPATLFPFFIIFYILIFDRGSSSVLQMFTETPISFILFAASLSTLLISILYFMFFENFTLRKIFSVTYQSTKSSIPSVTIIILAWTLADILRTQLNFGQEISSLISGSIPLFLMPLVFFWTSALVSGSLGTSWGTVAIFIPLVAPIVIHMQGLEPPVILDQIPLLLPSLGAVVSGAALGDHVSLLSDSTVLSSSGAQCHLVDHVKTQLPYAIPVFLGSSLGFLVAGIIAASSLSLSVIIPLSISISISLFIVLLMNSYGNRKARSF